MYEVLFSISTIHTLSGSSLAVFLTVQLIQELPIVRAIPTKALTVIIGELVLLLTTSPLPSSRVEWMVLLLNGFLAASAAFGGWRLLRRDK
jgi:hypothetical protein